LVTQVVEDPKTKITKVAQDTISLESRIAANIGFQQIDLNEWIFERLTVPGGSKVLELCCGTGAQTVYLTEQVGNSGEVYAIDVSSEAIEKLLENEGGERKRNLIPIEDNIDNFPGCLEKKGHKPPYFDCVFCAYGLYYSSDIGKTLSEIKEWLKPEGVFAVVGPFGPNNQPLYEVLKLAGVEIPEVVHHTSASFMLSNVAPWAAEHFTQVDLHTMVNSITWDEPERFLSYWRHSTFYDESRLEAVTHLLDRHFARNGCFTNQKWVMLLIARGMR
jgi:ubiquinone/menaquinone biosynthesis C-methylase UbiE